MAPASFIFADTILSGPLLDEIMKGLKQDASALMPMRRI
jgi:hypothetical protein